MYIDSHIHIYKLSKGEINALIREDKYLFVSVAEDIKSSLENLKLSLEFEEIIPCIGIHPWNVENIKKEHLKYIETLIEKSSVKILGEIGLDKKFHPETFDKQIEVFRFFIELAKEYDLGVNLHAAGAWREVFNLLLEKDIKKAYFHWYTGPIDLLKEIESVGYLIGINVSSLIQKKQKEILEKADISTILTESDGPYFYKDLFLHPKKLKELYNLILKTKNVSKDFLDKTLRKNLSNLIY